MIGERENVYPDTNYGTLVVHKFDIDGNQISAFYDSGNNLVFVLDNTINIQKPNVLLVINPDGDKKWDEILSSDYDIDLETIRPKVDNKYQKLDIEYSGLSVYENLINAYKEGDALEDSLNQLNILRDSASRHSAMMRLNVANEIISKTNATIVKTKETIVRLETRIKTLRSKLSSAKKEIGKVNTKQSASKILKLESQIEATNEKLKRAKKRLESAQKRLEVATVDAELASNLLNQPAVEIKQKIKNKPVMVAPEYPLEKVVDEKNEEIPEDFEEIEDEDSVLDEKESDVKPLFEEDPQILNQNIAFKPISFDSSVSDETKNEELVRDITPVIETRPVLESMTPVPEESNFSALPVPETIPEVDVFDVPEEKPVIDTITPVIAETDFIADLPDAKPEEPVVPENPVVPETPVMPVAPITPVINKLENQPEIKKDHSKPGFVYYVLLFVLILLSVFTLWLYQKNMKTDSIPVLTAKAPETTVLKPRKSDKKVVEPVINNEEKEPVFLDDAKPENKEEVVKEDIVAPVAETVAEPEQTETVTVEGIESEETFVEPDTKESQNLPVVMDAVPERVKTSGLENPEENIVVSEEDILANKPVYEPGAKYDNMFVNEEDLEYDFVPSYEDDDSEIYETENSFFDEEETDYQEEVEQ